MNREAQSSWLVLVALSRLRIKVIGTDGPTLTSFYSHFTAMVSSAGAMVGPYNYTAKSRLMQLEHAVLLSQDSREVDRLREGLRSGWEAIESPLLTFLQSRKRRSSINPTVFNPYKRN